MGKVKNKKTEGWVLQTDFPSEYGRGDRFVDTIVQTLTERRWPDGIVFAVNLALVEAITNAISHGNGCDPTKSVHVGCAVDEEKIVVSIRDEGKGFDVQAISDPRDETNLDLPTGRGILLMRSFMDDVWYNESGNELHMLKNLVNS